MGPDPQWKITSLVNVLPVGSMQQQQSLTSWLHGRGDRWAVPECGRSGRRAAPSLLPGGVALTSEAPCTLMSGQLRPQSQEPALPLSG